MEQRIIRFKAKRLDNNEWVEGDLQHNRDQVFITSGGYVLAEVDPSTVCQYTGLKDKNGKPIYEGDVLKLVLGTKVIVVWETEQCWFSLFKEGYGCSYCPFNKSIAKDFNVLGSKFDKEA